MAPRVIFGALHAVVLRTRRQIVKTSSFFFNFEATLVLWRVNLMKLFHLRCISRLNASVLGLLRLFYELILNVVENTIQDSSGTLLDLGSLDMM